MLRKMLIAIAVVAVLAVVVLGAGAFYFSTLLTADGDPWESRGTAVLEVDEATVTLGLDDHTALDGQHGLLWDDGVAQLDGQVALDEDATTVTYALAEGSVVPPAETDAAWYGWYYDGDPGDLGLEFSEVSVPSRGGDLLAWYLPGEGDTWVMAVHGHDADRGETLRALPTLAELGLPTLSVRFRNDEGVLSPDGLEHLGDTEWQDVDAAMTWAVEQGAERFVLYGWSMGGAIVLQAQDRGQNADRVEAVVLDGPVVDWRATISLQAASRGLPFLAPVVEQITEWRIGIDFDDFDWVARADELDVPILAFHGPDDDYVAWEPTRDLAATRPDLVTFEQVDRAGHTRSWNTDPERYEQALASFLTAQVG